MLEFDSFGEFLGKFSSLKVLESESKAIEYLLFSTCSELCSEMPGDVGLYKTRFLLGVVSTFTVFKC